MNSDKRCNRCRSALTPDEIADGSGRCEACLTHPVTHEKWNKAERDRFEGKVAISALDRFLRAPCI